MESYTGKKKRVLTIIKQKLQWLGRSQMKEALQTTPCKEEQMELTKEGDNQNRHWTTPRIGQVLSSSSSIDQQMIVKNGNIVYLGPSSCHLGPSSCHLGPSSCHLGPSSCHPSNLARHGTDSSRRNLFTNLHRTQFNLFLHELVLEIYWLVS